MRKMPRPGPAVFADWPKGSGPEVGWSMSSHVYPDFLAVRSFGAPECDERFSTDERIVWVKRYQIHDVARYTTYVGLTPSGQPTDGMDSVIPTRGAIQGIDDVAGALTAGGLAPTDRVDALVTHMTNVITRTVRLIMAGWWRSLGEFDRPWADEVLDKLVSQCVFREPHVLPIGDREFPDFRELTVPRWF